MIIIFLLPLLFVGANSGIAAANTKPNIILIVTDDQRIEDCEHMPLLQRLLVKNGLSMQNYFCNVSLCCPARTSILRGQLAHNTGVLTDAGHNGGFAVANACGVESSTISIWLHNSGYKTALIGKYLNGYPGKKGFTYIPSGWDYWVSSVRGNPYLQYNYTLNENGKLVKYGHSVQDYGTDVYLHKALAFINHCQTVDKPFFLYLAFYAPHAPATPAPRHTDLFQNIKIPRTPAFNEADLSDKPKFMQKLPLLTAKQIEKADSYYRKRLCSLQAVDEAIQSIYDTLKQNQQLENTYIFFTTDNGFHIGEHRMPRGKQTAYETDIHLPLIITGPQVKNGADKVHLLGNIDLAPTFADLAGAKVPSFVDGKSFAGLLHGQSQPDRRESFLIEYQQQEGKNLSLIDLFHKIQMRSAGREFGHIPQYRATRYLNHISIDYETGEKEVYNFEDDPDEIGLGSESPKNVNHFSDQGCSGTTSGY